MTRYEPVAGTAQGGTEIEPFIASESDSDAPIKHGRRPSDTFDVDDSRNLDDLSDSRELPSYERAHMSMDEHAEGRFSGETSAPGSLTYWHGLALVVGLQVGSGIFSSPRQINQHAGSVAASLLVWVISGLLAWTGAASYSELGSAIPVNGGTQAYLDRIFGPLPSFMYTWTALTILKPGSMAIISLVFGEYAARGMNIENSVVAEKLFAFGLVLVIIALNGARANMGSAAGKAFFFLKLILLALIFLVGMAAVPVYGYKGAFAHGIFDGTSHSVGGYAIALYSGLWAYDGWDNLNFVSGEMRDPHRDLPRVIATAMPLVIVGYVLVNIAYYVVMTKSEINLANSVSLTMMYKVLGSPGRAVTAILIALSCAGALNASMFSAARLIRSAAQERFLPIWFEKQSRVNTPIRALLLQAALTSVYIVSGEFRSLTQFYGSAGYIFFLTAVAGLLVLRVREPGLARPYRVNLATPILFCVVATFLIVRSLLERPLVFLGMVGFILLSIPIYFVRLRWLIPVSAGQTV